MYLVWLAWKNLWRNRSRTLITVSAVFFSVILSVLASSLKSGIFEQLVKNVAGIYSGYIQLHRKGYWNEQMIDNGFQISNNLENKIKASDKVSALAPRLESFALVSAGESTKGCMVIGIDPQAESTIIQLDKRLVKGKYLNKDLGHDALVSDGLIKISFRSKGDFSAKEFASNYFEGGGHKNASGGKSLLSLDQTVARFLDVLKHYQQKLNS